LNVNRPFSLVIVVIALPVRRMVAYGMGSPVATLRTNPWTLITAASWQRPVVAAKSISIGTIVKISRMS
jgi:hypothetical protein